MCGEFDLFVDRVDPRYQSYVSEIHLKLMKRGCGLKMKITKSGFVVSYIRKGTKGTLATFVQCKSSIKLRAFTDHIAEFQEFLDAFPRRMRMEIRKALVRKRLLDPNGCNPRRRVGYTSAVECEQYQKCRYMAFSPTLNEGSHPHISQLLHKGLDRVDSES